ncbi:MAG: NUDIX domain-containing protein [Nanoarchaeota archaeon]|nr:NUDIX domain-containing protein [Nanoarchaeota archaeon]
MGKLTDYKQPSVAADIVVFTIMNRRLNVLLIQRGKEPFAGFWCVPGGFVQIDEAPEDAALRELKEETGVTDVYLEQLYTFGKPGRDPRGRVISISYFALVDSTKIKPKLTGDEQIKKVEWFDVNELPQMGFDHKDIVSYALKRLRYKLEYSAVGFELLPEKFTLTDLQSLYETILNESVDKRNFRKKVMAMGIVEKTREKRKGSHRPAMLYMFRQQKASSAFKKVKFER